MAEHGKVRHLCLTYAWRAVNSKKAKTITATGVLATWRLIVETRERLKADTLAARTGATTPRVLSVRQAARQSPLRASRRRTSLMELRLLDVDASLAEAARLARGWRKLAALHRDALRLAPKRARPVVRDVVAQVAAETNLAEQQWYVGGRERERAVDRLLAPWADIRRARAVLLGRIRRGATGAQSALALLDLQIIRVVEAMRIAKQLRAVLDRHVSAHRLHGQLLAVRRLLEDLRTAERAVMDLLAGVARDGVPPLFAKLVVDAARQHGAHGATFARLRDRAFFRAYADRVNGVARALRRPVSDLQEAILADDVQALIGTNIARATARILARLRIAKPRTAQERIAKSDATYTKL